MSTLDSTKAFDDIWRNWTVTGGNPPKNHETIYKYYTVFVVIMVLFLGPLQLIVEIFFIEDFNKLMMHISTSLELLCIALKMIFVYTFRKSLLEANEYLTKLDKRANENPTDRSRMEQIVRNSAFLYSWTKNSYGMALGLYIFHGVLTRNTVLDGWFPFDWRSSTALYIIALSFQIFYTGFLTLMVAGADTYMMLGIYIFIGHTKCLARRISNIGYGNEIVQQNSEENYQELVTCIKYHRNTHRYLNCLSSMISATFLIQFMVTAIVISSTMISAVVLSEDIMFLLKFGFYIVGIMLQVLPCCYLGSQMTDESSKLTTAIYSCNWMDQDVKFRKTLIIFMLRSQQPNEMFAGNMISISLPTFVSLIKMSYSLFTIFSST